MSEAPVTVRELPVVSRVGRRVEVDSPYATTRTTATTHAPVPRGSGVSIGSRRLVGYR
jgi:hypothetical protein